MRGIWSLLIIGCVFLGCAVPDHKYKVVAMKTYYDKSESYGQGGQMIEFTISHDGATIKARCQVWDTKNHCDRLEVGKSYDLVRDRKYMDALCLYDGPVTLPNGLPAEATVVLTVEEEKMRNP